MQENTVFYRIFSEAHFHRKKAMLLDRAGFRRRPPLFSAISFLQKLTPETLPPLGWWLVAGGWWLVAGWLVAGGWAGLAGGWRLAGLGWLVAGGW